MAKNIRYFPCGLAVYEKINYRKTPKSRNKPNRTLVFTKPYLIRIVGKVYPVHPISSKEPAGMPNKKPSAEVGVYSDETTVFKNISVTWIRNGGVIRANKYHLIDTFHLPMRKLKFLSPVLPWFIFIKIILATTGPTIITGNISIPLVVDTTCLLNNFGAIKIRYPASEIINVVIK